MKLKKIFLIFFDLKDSSKNSEYKLFTNKLIKRARDQEIVLPKELSRFNDYRKNAKRIEIREGALSRGEKINFRFVLYKNKEIGDVEEYYRYQFGGKGEGIISLNPILYHFDLNKNGVNKVNEDGGEWLYDEKEDGPNGNENYEDAIFLFQNRSFP